jgi:hypothetical protein
MDYDAGAVVAQATRRLVAHLPALAEGLPGDPVGLARVAAASPENARRLACCARLFALYAAAVPPVALRGDAPLSLDRHNPSFESDLTVSDALPPSSLTTLFSCLLAAIGRRAVRLFAQSPSSPNPFAQCARAAFRLTWMLRCRCAAVRALREHNRLAFVSHALRIASFPDFDASAPRGALFAALDVPDRVDLARFAHLLPLRALTDSTRPFYEELKGAMAADRQAALGELELAVEDAIRRKEAPVFFGSRLDPEDSLFLELLSVRSPRDREIWWENPLKTFVLFMLYEIGPDRQRDQFLGEFVRAGDLSAKMRFERARRFQRVTIEIVTDPPIDHSKESQSQEEPKKEPPKGQGFDIFALFRPPRDFIADTKYLRA